MQRQITVYMKSGNQLTMGRVTDWSIETDDKSGKVKSLNIQVENAVPPDEIGSVIRMIDLSQVEAVVETVINLTDEN